MGWNGEKKIVHEKHLEGFKMVIYWKSATNQMMNESEFIQTKEVAETKIREWGIHHLHLDQEFLGNFVSQKLEEYSRSFIKLNLPFETEKLCLAHLEQFYQDHVEIISLFPYDRWAWINLLETIHFGAYEIESVTVESQIHDCKELQD